MTTTITQVLSAEEAATLLLPAAQAEMALGDKFGSLVDGSVLGSSPVTVTLVYDNTPTPVAPTAPVAPAVGA